MSSQTPHTGPRKTNGAPSAPSQPNGPSKGKDPSKSTSSRGGRGRRQPSNGEKVVVRRLPPGMTEHEFLAILGSEWHVGSGKVDWIQYADGKTPKDPSKPATPARCSMHVVKRDHIVPLGDAVRDATWEDAKGTFTNPCLLSTPVLELAMYKKVPSNKKRTDTRQGTIDQDPDYMAFLESLTKPDKIDENPADDDLGVKPAKVTSTPLTEFLKEKKASKGRDGGRNSKHTRQGSAATKGKGAGKEEEAASSKRKGRDGRSDKREKAPKETVKILTKKAVADQKSEAEKPEATSNAASATDAPKSRRAGIAAAARLLQRDLGLSPGTAHRRARQDAAKADAGAKSAPTSQDNTEPSSGPASAARPASPSTSNDQNRSKTQSSAPAAPKSQTGRRGRGGKNADRNKAPESPVPAPASITPTMILKKKPESETATPTEASKKGAPAQKPATTPEASSASAAPANANGKSPAKSSGGRSAQKKSPAIAAGAKRGFVKHANPSQGVTEANLREALQAFGTVSFIEIDKRKGFAYVDFAEHDGLAKAAAASPISVAQGAVQVLERKDKKPAAAAAPASSAEAATGSSSPAAPSSTAGTPQPAEGTKSAGGRGRRGRGGGRRNNAAGNAKDGNGAGSNSERAAPAPATSSTNGGG